MGAAASATRAAAGAPAQASGRSVPVAPRWVSISTPVATIASIATDAARGPVASTDGRHAASSGRHAAATHCHPASAALSSGGDALSSGGASVAGWSSSRLLGVLPYRRTRRSTPTRRPADHADHHEDACTDAPPDLRLPAPPRRARGGRGDRRPRAHRVHRRPERRRRDRHHPRPHVLRAARRVAVPPHRRVPDRRRRRGSGGRGRDVRPAGARRHGIRAARRRGRARGIRHRARGRRRRGARRSRRGLHARVGRPAASASAATRRRGSSAASSRCASCCPPRSSERMPRRRPTADGPCPRHPSPTPRGSRTAAPCSTSPGTSSPSRTCSRYIDAIALVKLNVLHLHLTDDQGWRIQIDSWPELTRIGASTSVGGDGGGFYTKDDYRAHRRVRGRAVRHDRARDRPARAHERGAERLPRAELRRRRPPAPYEGHRGRILLALRLARAGRGHRPVPRRRHARGRRAHARARGCTSAATSRSPRARPTTSTWCGG